MEIEPDPRALECRGANTGGPMLWACQKIAAQYIPRQFSPFPTEAGQFKLSSLTSRSSS